MSPEELLKLVGNEDLAMKLSNELKKERRRRDSKWIDSLVDTYI